MKKVLVAFLLFFMLFLSACSGGEDDKEDVKDPVNTTEGEDEEEGEEDSDDTIDGDGTFTIDLNSSNSGSLESENSHLYEFTLTTDGFITAYLESGFDSVGSIIDGYGNVLTLSDDESFENTNFKIDNYPLNAGTYYLYVYGYSSTDYGDYTVNILFNIDNNNDDDEDEDDVSDSEIFPNSFLVGDLESNQTNSVTFTLEQGGYINAYLESSFGGFDSEGALFNSNRELILENSDDGGFLDFALSGIYLNPGTYEIDISGKTSGEYGNYMLYLDVIYGDKNDALLVGNTGNLESELDLGEYKWYKFELTESGYFYSYLVSSFNSYGYLLDENGFFITQDSYNYGNDDFYLSSYLQPGFYYVVVKGNSELESGDFVIYFNYSEEYTTP